MPQGEETTPDVSCILLRLQEVGGTLTITANITTWTSVLLSKPRGRGGSGLGWSAGG